MSSLITTTEIYDLEYVTYAQTQFIKTCKLVEELLDSFKLGVKIIITCEKSDFNARTFP